MKLKRDFVGGGRMIRIRLKEVEVVAARVSTA